MAVERKYERDIDLLLAEEFSVNPEFADWVKSRTKFFGHSANVTDVFVSKADNLGESDLIVIYSGKDGQRFAVMIEDKIDALLQPNQAERYRFRAEREVESGAFTAYAVILCAPEYYISNSKRVGEFDLAISFEELAKFLRRSDSSSRNQYRAAFLETAATKRVNNWVREVDEATEEFWEAAYDMATKDFPILEMKRLKVTKDSSWINFRPADMPTLPRRIYVSVKGDRGQMDLTFSNTKAHLFHERVATLLDPEMTIHQTSASAAIRIEVETFTPRDGIEMGLPRVRGAFEACERLIRFYRANKIPLDAAAVAAANGA
jgi:hypothetical protein